MIGFKLIEHNDHPLSARHIQDWADPMKKVVIIPNHREEKKQKQEVEVHNHKIETMKRIVLCSSCHLRCAMCGEHMEGSNSCCPNAYQDSLNLCECCRTEFDDFLVNAKGEKGPDIFWHNKEWVRLWSAWLDYRRAIREFKNSAEFKQLTTELDN